MGSIVVSLVTLDGVVEDPGGSEGFARGGWAFQFDRGPTAREGSAIYRVIPAGELKPRPSGTIAFEGEPYGSGVSVFLVDDEPGAGPELHSIRTRQRWIVRSGKARCTADGVNVEAGPGDVVVAGPETPHRFENVGTDRLEVVCIHASPRLIQESLAE